MVAVAGDPATKTFGVGTQPSHQNITDIRRHRSSKRTNKRQRPREVKMQPEEYVVKLVITVCFCKKNTWRTFAILWTQKFGSIGWKRGEYDVTWTAWTRRVQPFRGNKHALVGAFAGTRKKVAQAQSRHGRNCGSRLL